MQGGAGRYSLFPFPLSWCSVSICEWAESCGRLERLHVGETEFEGEHIRKGS